jgi:hypothetical protein
MYDAMYPRRLGANAVLRNPSDLRKMVLYGPLSTKWLGSYEKIRGVPSGIANVIYREPTATLRDNG